MITTAGKAVKCGLANFTNSSKMLKQKV